MRSPLVFATSNIHKVEEVRAITDGLLQIVTPGEMGLQHLQLPETADTLEGNAIQKARALYELTGRDCFAEDTGLECDALGGRPGVYSARYAGMQSNAQDNIRKLLNDLEGVELRTARFRAVFALMIQNAIFLFEGTTEGRIATSPHGIDGFGYDPVFIPEGYQQTFAELGPNIKMEISHRTRAIRNMIAFLQSSLYI